jgi:hypothetical protein
MYLANGVFTQLTGILGNEIEALHNVTLDTAE